ncbi:TPA: lytic transglycosylase domain-containing protein [Enterobacter cloacae]|nr:lytic transglycosylase domain-containing protein [Enterobacter cloacae]
MAFDIKQYTIDEAKRQGVDPDFALALMGVESGGNPNAVSKTGAYGAYQMFPAAVKDVGGDYEAMKKDPALQVQYGISYAKQKLKEANGDYAKALGYYNQGKSGFDKQLKSGQFAPEVVNYVNRPEFAPFVKDSQLTQIANPVKTLEGNKPSNKFSTGSLYRGDRENEPTQADIAQGNASPNQQIQQQANQNAITQPDHVAIAKQLDEENQRYREMIAKQQADKKADAWQTAATGIMAAAFGNNLKNTVQTQSGIGLGRGASQYGSTTAAALNRFRGFNPDSFNGFSINGRG